MTMLIILLIAVACIDDAISPPDDAEPPTIEIRLLADSTLASVIAMWMGPSEPAPGLDFPWTAAAKLGEWDTSGVATTETVTFNVPRLGVTIQAEFCVWSRRIVDGLMSSPTCAEYLILGVEPPLPPDSLLVDPNWDVLTHQWHGQTFVVGAYLDYFPEVSYWLLSEAGPGVWVIRDSAINQRMPLGTDSVPPTPHYPCETGYTYTGNPDQVVNTGPWEDGDDWRCREDGATRTS